MHLINVPACTGDTRGLNEKFNVYHIARNVLIVASPCDQFRLEKSSFISNIAFLTSFF